MEGDLPFPVFGHPERSEGERPADTPSLRSGRLGEATRVPEDIYDRIVGVMLMIFLFFFFVGTKLTRFPLPVRVEDLIFIMLVPMSYRYLKRPKTPLFWWIAFYFGINLIPYFAAAAVGEYDLSIYPVIVIKEMEYFYIAYLIC